MTNTTILKNALPDEIRRTVLHEAEHRYRHELLDDEERMMLLDRIKRIRCRLEIKA